MGEDEDAAGARGFDQADRRHRLAGAGGVLEPEAPLGAGVLRRLVDRLLVAAGVIGPVERLLVGRQRLVVHLGLSVQLLVVDLFGLGLRTLPLLLRLPRLGGWFRILDLDSTVAPAVLRRGLLLGNQLGQGPREGVDLMQRQLGTVSQLRRLVGEQPLEPEQQREVLAPLDRWLLGTGFDLRQGGIEGPPPGGPGGECLRALPFEQEGLPGELRRPLDLCA